MPETAQNVTENAPDIRYTPAEIEPRLQAQWDADPMLYAAEPHTGG